MTPVMIASHPASATYCGLATGARPASPAARIAALAESAPTTRCRDDPSRATSGVQSGLTFNGTTATIYINGAAVGSLDLSGHARWFSLRLVNVSVLAVGVVRKDGFHDQQCIWDTYV